VKTLLTVLSSTLIPLAGLAGEFNKVLSPGDAAPAFADLAGTDGKKHALADWKETPVVVVVFTCNSCPVANDYEGRIKAFAEKHAAGKNAKVALIAIDSNTGSGESLAKMTERATKKKYSYPYLADPDGKAAMAYGANYTPEFFVLDKDRKVVYLGAMDDKNDAATATVNYVEKAVEAVLGGKKVEKAETLGRGCRVKLAAK
jgi:peroxiredoxin